MHVSVSLLHSDLDSKQVVFQSVDEKPGHLLVGELARSIDDFYHLS